MFLNNYQETKNKETSLLVLIFLISFLIRTPVIFILGDTVLENEWKTLVDNLTIYKKLSLTRFGDLFVPNLFMPPFYAFFLYFFKIFNFNNELYIQTILFSQVFLSSLSISIFYCINRFFFSKNISLIGAMIFSLFPLSIYAPSQISSASLQSFFIITFFYFFFKTINKKNLFNICFLSITSGLLMLLRGEFILLFLISILYLGFFFKVNFKSIILIIFFTLVTISPYIARNLVLFDTITITKSIGYNLWKGNNPNSAVEGGAIDNEQVDKKLSSVKKNKYYEINIDKIYLNEGIKNILNDPYNYITLFFKKFFTLIFVDFNSSQKYYYHPINFLPTILLGITSILGIIISNKKSHKNNYLILFFLTNIAIMSIFFILPRYKLAVIPLQIIFSNYLFEYVKKYYLKK